VLLSDTGMVPSFIGNLEWGFYDPTELNPSNTFREITDIEVEFIPTKAYTTVKIWARYYDPQYNIDISDTIDVTVIPGPAAHVVIEATPDSLTSLHADNPKPSVTIGANETGNSGFYAILRDQYQNWVGPATNATWSSDDESIVTAGKGSNVNQGQGKATRVSSSGQTEVHVRTHQGFTDKIAVILENTEFTDLMIVAKDNTGEFVKTESITLDITENQTDTTVYILGYPGSGTNKDDLSQWEQTSADWSSSGLKLTATSSTGASWTFIPTGSGSGTITASVSGSSGSQISDDIQVTITNTVPKSIALYNKKGDPSEATQYGAETSVSADDSLPIVAKLTNSFGEFISAYESNILLGNSIKWGLASTEFDATLTPSEGVRAVFSSQDAWDSYTVTVSISGTDINPVSLNVEVLPSTLIKNFKTAHLSTINVAVHKKAIHLASDLPLPTLSIKILSLNGRIVNHWEGSGLKALDISSVPSGHYLLSMDGVHKRRTMRVVLP